MIEFVMSRVWMVIAGLAILVVIMSAFTGLNDRTGDDAARASAVSLADLIEEFKDGGREGEVRIEARNILVDDTRSMVVRNGSIWVHSGTGDRAVEGPSGIELIEHGEPVEELKVGWDDILVLRSSGPGDGRENVQLEKVEATSSTASMNFRHSVSVL